MTATPMKLPLYQIDAFTSRMFGGNPAAVVLLDAWLPDDVLKAIAAENNLAETAGVRPREVCELHVVPYWAARLARSALVAK